MSLTDSERPHHSRGLRRWPPRVCEGRDVSQNSAKNALRADVRARQHGKRNLPPTETVTLDPVEREIVAKFEAERKVQLDDFLQQIKVRDDRIADYHSGPAPVEIAALGDKADARFK